MFLLNFKYQVLLPVIIILLLCLYENNALKKTMRKIHLTVNMFLKKITSCCRNQENQVKNEDRPLPTAEEGDLIIAVDTVFAAIGLGNSLRRERMETIIKENIKDIEIMCPDSNSNCEKMAVEVELKQIMTKVWQAEVKEQKEQVMRRNSIKEVDSKKGMNQVIYKFEIDESEPNRPISMLSNCAETHNITVDDFNSLSNFSLPDQISASVKCTLACMLAHTKLVDSQTGRFISASRIFIVKLLIKTLHSSIKDFYPEFKVVNSGRFFDTFFNLVDICKNIDIERGLDKCEVAYKYTLCAMQQQKTLFNELKTEWMKARNEKKRRRQEWEKQNKEDSLRKSRADAEIGEEDKSKL